MASIYDQNGDTITEGLQGCNVSDEAIQMAHRIANERGETVTLVDDDGEWEVAPDSDDDAIETLRAEAAAAGDDAQVALCTSALEGDADARRECARVIAEAAAQAADYVWSPANADSDGQDTSGSLEDAMAYAAAWDVTLTLRSANGETRGWVKPSGDYNLQ